jgi:uncharacterized protein (DUF1501 family)
MNTLDPRPLSIDRRGFLAAAGSGLVAASLGFAGPAGAAFDDFRALVCVFLFGGNDAFNMVVPRSAAEHDAYARSRQNLAIGRDALLPIEPSTGDGALYGLHPRMGALKQLFDAGRLAVVANAGPLVRPVTKEQFLQRAVPVPPQLFSHNDQQDQWQTAKGLRELQTGWAGRAADLVAGDLAGQALPMNVSLAGTSVFQIGADASPYAIGNDGAPTFIALTNPQAGFYAERRAMFERLLAVRQPSPIGRALTAVQARSLELAGVVNGALAAAPPIATPFPGSPLGAQLAAVARLISVRDRLGMRRQVFFVATGGFDTHDDQNQLQPGLLGDVADSLAAFDAALLELGAARDVVTFTQSDFGRTLTSNGDGTDHGWGAHQLVLGGPVAGRDIYGTMPRLEIGGPDDVGGGRIVPTLSVDQYAATLLRWFGLGEGQLDAVLPNLRNFASRDLRFLA